MTLLCIEYKVCSLDYFMDELQPYEVYFLTKNLQKSIRWDWEMTRQLAYMTAQVNSTKKLKPTDIMKFDWDNENKKRSVNIDKERLKRLAERMTKK